MSQDEIDELFSSDQQPSSEDHTTEHPSVKSADGALPLVLCVALFGTAVLFILIWVLRGFKLACGIAPLAGLAFLWVGEWWDARSWAKSFERECPGCQNKYKPYESRRIPKKCDVCGYVFLRCDICRMNLDQTPDPDNPEAAIARVHGFALCKRHHDEYASDAFGRKKLKEIARER